MDALCASLKLLNNPRPNCSVQLPAAHLLFAELAGLKPSKQASANMKAAPARQHDWELMPEVFGVTAGLSF